MGLERDRRDRHVGGCAEPGRLRARIVVGRRSTSVEHGYFDSTRRFNTLPLLASLEADRCRRFVRVPSLDVERPKRQAEPLASGSAA
jgi:hypothetical protein